MSVIPAFSISLYDNITLTFSTTNAKRSPLLSPSLNTAVSSSKLILMILIANPTAIQKDYEHQFNCSHYVQLCFSPVSVFPNELLFWSTSPACI